MHNSNLRTHSFCQCHHHGCSPRDVPPVDISVLYTGSHSPPSDSVCSSLDTDTSGALPWNSWARCGHSTRCSDTPLSVCPEFCALVGWTALCLSRESVVCPSGTFSASACDLSDSCNRRYVHMACLQDLPTAVGISYIEDHRSRLSG